MTVSKQLIKALELMLCLQQLHCVDKYVKEANQSSTMPEPCLCTMAYTFPSIHAGLCWLPCAELKHGMRGMTALTTQRRKQYTPQEETRKPEQTCLSPSPRQHKPTAVSHCSIATCRAHKHCQTVSSPVNRQSLIC